MLLEYSGYEYRISFGIIPEGPKGCTQWQYGTSTTASQKHCILGEVDIHAASDTERIVKIRYIALEGSFQCILGSLQENVILFTMKLMLLNFLLREVTIIYR